ncbi:MAG TPA: hypothetical protein DCO79_01200 [Spirochaeta sp.]|nr:hypothetical protein [Spirochaeta sp.]
MQWENIRKDPKIIENYQLLNETGLLEHIESMRIENVGLNNLLNEAFEISRQESVEELVNFVIKCLSDKFIPSSLIFVLNQGIMVNRIKILAYKNLKAIESNLKVDTLDPYEKFFRKYTGTTSFMIFEHEIGNQDLVTPFEDFNPEIIVPVIGRTGLYGIILFGPKVLGPEYTADEISYLDKLIKFTSIGIQNNIHYEHSVREPKTGLYNHNFFIRRLDEEIARAKRAGNSFSIIMLDIDNFKQFNDNYGHMAGDEIILRLAATIRYVMREEDIISRFGGEEFTVLLPEAEGENAWAAAERLRKEVEEMTVDYGRQSLHITISLGIATFDGGNTENFDLIEQADAALYISKSKGRNQTSASASNG